MRIRPAGPADVEAVRAIVTAAYTPWIARIGMEPGPMGDDHAAQVAAGQVDVAEDEHGTVVGLIVLARHPDHLLIENVAVDPGVQGRGVGRALLEHAEAQAADTGELRLHTHELMAENRALYERIGYRETGRRHPVVFFVKRL